MSETTEKLAAIEALEQAATPGPWANYGDLTHEVYPTDAHEDDEPENIAHEVPRLEDAAFIAASRTAVPFLLGLVREQAARLAKVTKLVGDLTDPDDCSFDHHGGCQAHGYLSLQPGEICPQLDAKAWVYNHSAALGVKT